MKHPFPFIAELKDLKKVDTLSDLLFLQDLVFSLVPWKKVPHIEPIVTNFEAVYNQLKLREIGGWCGLNAEFLKVLLNGYGVPCLAHDYGLVKYQFTHIVIKAELDGMVFLLDPYFNCTYTYKDEFVLQYPDLLRFLNNKKMDIITSKFGPGKKYVETENGMEAKNGPEFEKMVVDGFIASGLNNIMQDVFNSTDIKLLMLLKIPTPPRL